MQYTNDEFDDEQGISIGQVLAVLFGRKIVFFSVWAGVFLIGLIFFKFGIDKKQRSYYSDFKLTDNILETESYSDGEPITIHKLVSLANIYSVAERAGIDKKTAEKIYYSSKFVVKRLEEVTSDKEDSEKNIYFHIELPAASFSGTSQARKFIQGIADLPNETQKNILTNQVNDQYLKLYASAKTYDLQLNYLVNQYELLDDRYNSLIATYGDVFLSDGNKLSNLKVELEEYFKNHPFEELQNQIVVGGYVKGSENEKTIYENEIISLTNEKNVLEAKLSDLVSQRDQLINTASNLQTVELTEYNSKIIELTLRNRDIEKLLDDYNHKIENLEKLETDEDLKNEMAEFESSLNLVKSKLDSLTEKYISTASYVALNYSITYFENTSVVKVSSGFGLIKLIAYPLLAGLVIALAVNLCLDGKKLTKNYKLVHVSMIKETKKEENEDNKTA